MLLVIVTVNVAVLVQVPEVASIEYVVFVVGATVMVPVVAPVLHE